jgi:hypothetical protein
MADYEQMAFDVRLDSERELEENVNLMIEFAHKQLMAEVGESTVRNRHEGYGILAEANVELNGSLKSVKDSMVTFLRTLPLNDSRAIEAVSSIDNSLTKVVLAAVRMAAEAKRINDDLYVSLSGHTTPLEDYLNEQEDEFEEAGDLNEKEEASEDGSEAEGD